MSLKPCSSILLEIDWNGMVRAGMSREFIQELRGDARKDAIDIYDHMDQKELRESYLAYIPQLEI